MTNVLTRRFLAATAITLVACTGVTGTSAQAQTRDRDRIERLEGQIRDLQAVVYSVERQGAPVRQGAVSAQPAAQAPAQSPNDVLKIAQLEEQIAQLTGRIEEITFRLANQQRQLDTIMAVLGETRGGGTPADQAAATSDADADTDAEGADVADIDAPMTDTADVALDDAASDASQGAPADLSGALPPREEVTVDLPEAEDDAYDVAYEALLAGDYARSEAAFEAYVEQFPDGVRTAEAKYLLGEIYLATGAYAEAATTFLDHVKAYPDDVRASEAYLKLGTAFARLDKPDEACKVFSVGASKFPQMSASVRARFEAEQRKAGC